MRYRACNRRMNRAHARFSKVIMKPKPSIAIFRVVKVATPRTRVWKCIYSEEYCDEDDVLTYIDTYRALRIESRLG